METNITGANFTRYNAHAANLPTFDPTIGSGNGGFTNATSGRNTVLNQIRDSLDASEDLRTALEEGMADITDSRAKTSLERLLKGSGKELERNAKRLYSVAGGLNEKHAKAIALATEGYAKANTDLLREYSTAKAQLLRATPSNSTTVSLHGVDFAIPDQPAKDRAVEALESHFNRASDRLKAVRDELVHNHTDSISELKTLVGDVEKASGVKVPEKATTALAKTAENLEKAAEHTGGKLTFKSGAGFLLGGAATLIGGKALMQDLGMLEAPRGADGEPEKGNFVMDAALTAAGLAGLVMGKRAYHAAGHSKF